MKKISMYQESFKFSRDGKVLMANLSDLDENKEPFWVNDQMSFIVVSSFTKRELVWELKKIHKTPDNKITKWEFAPSKETSERHPSITRNKLIIFNV